MVNAGGLHSPISLAPLTLTAAAVPSPRARFLFRNEKHLPLGRPTPPPALPVLGPVQLFPALRGLRGNSVCLKRTVFNTPFTQADVADGFHESRSEAALVPGSAGATCGWGVPILSGQPGLPTPTAPAPMTPGLVSSRKATGLQGRPVCEPERFTGLPRAQGSLLSGQAPVGQAAWPRAGICLPPPPTRTGL